MYIKYIRRFINSCHQTVYIVFLVGIGRVGTEEASAPDQREEGVKQRRGLSRSTRGYIARWVSTSPLSGKKSRFLSFAFQLKCPAFLR